MIILVGPAIVAFCERGVRNQIRTIDWLSVALVVEAAAREKSGGASRVVDESLRLECLAEDDTGLSPRIEGK